MMALVDETCVDFALQILDRIYNETNKLKGHIAKVTFLGIVQKYKSELKSDPNNEDDQTNKERILPTEIATTSADLSNLEVDSSPKIQNHDHSVHNRRARKNNVRCFNCHQEGHTQRQCKNEEVKFCKFCEKTNHRTEECRYLLSRIRNQNFANRRTNVCVI